MLEGKAIKERTLRRIGGLRERVQTVPKDVLFMTILALSCSASFGLGMLTERDLGQRSAFSIKEVPLEEMAVSAAAAEERITFAPATLPTSGEVVASKNGTKYYHPWCSGVSRIISANRITFPSAKAAEAKGYELSTTCKNPQ